jgi:ubiquinone biosynthesis protein UbiJ
MKQLVSTCLQSIINKYLSLDPEAAPKLAALTGKIVAVNIKGTSLNLTLVFTGTGVEIDTSGALTADTTISSPPLTLAQLIFNPSRRQKLFAQGATISGDMELGLKLMSLFDGLEIDLEEHLAKVIGDVPAHRIGQLARGLKSFLQNSADVFSQQVDEYAHEEKNVFPPTEALQDFFGDVDSFRMAVDRTEARVNALKASMGKSS